MISVTTGIPYQEGIQLYILYSQRARNGTLTAVSLFVPLALKV